MPTGSFRSLPRALSQLRVRERVLLALLLAAAAAHIAFWMEPFEDAYITFRYVRHLTHGLGLVWNAGERVEGCTSLGWVLLLAPLSLLGLPLPVAATALSIACAFFTVVAAALIARQVLLRREAWPLVVLGVVAAPGFAYWAGSGMETTAFLLLLSSGMALAWQPSSRAALGSGALLGLAFVLRPEGLGYAIAIAAANASLPTRRAHAVRLLLACAAIAVPLTLFRLSYFGWPLPNTYYAKAMLGDSRVLLLAGLRNTEQYVTSQLLFLILPLAAAVLWSHGSSGGSSAWQRVCGCVLGAALVNNVAVGGDVFVHYRFLLPALLPMLLLAVEAGLVLIARASATNHQARRQRMLAFGFAAWLGLELVAGVVGVPTLTKPEPQSTIARVRWLHDANADYFVVGRWLHTHFPKNTTLAVNAAGIVPYEADLPTIDMLGLNDVHIAHLTLRAIEGARGHEKHDAKYVLARKPDVIVPGLPVLAARRIHADELPAWYAQWVGYLPGDRELADQPALDEEYGFMCREIAPGKWLPLFLRLQGPRPSP